MHLFVSIIYPNIIHLNEQNAQRRNLIFTAHAFAYKTLITVYYNNTNRVEMALYNSDLFKYHK